MTPRAYRPDDEGGVRRLVTDAFGAEGAKVAGLVEELRRAHVRAEIVAEVEDGVAGHVAGQVVGHVALSTSWVDARRALVEVLVLSPLSVAPQRQRQGTGAALVVAAVAAAERLGAPAVFLEGDPRHYARHGFEAATPLGFVRPSVRIPEPAFQVRLLRGWEPWMRGALVYCEPFWSRDCVGLRDPDLARIEQGFEQ